MKHHRQRERLDCGLTCSLRHAWALTEDIVMRISYMKRSWAHQLYFKGKRKPGGGVRTQSKGCSAEVCLYIFFNLMIEFCPIPLCNCCGNACFCGQILKYCNVFTQIQIPVLSMSFLRKGRIGVGESSIWVHFSVLSLSTWGWHFTMKGSLCSLQLWQPCCDVGWAASALQDETHGGKWFGAEGSCSSRDRALLPQFHQCGYLWRWRTH